jgi:coenzyme F420-0:L-glutamate ligase
MKVIPIKTRIFRAGENLADFISKHLKNINENSVLVVTSKIVALSENRIVEIKNKKTKEKIIRAESDWALPTKHVWLAMKDGMFMASAGIDESNGDGKLILLPKNSFVSAQKICLELKKRYKIKKLGILITDSRVAPLRAGVAGVALGYAGFRGLKDYRGGKDIFGRPFHFSRVNIPDSLAAASVLVMGEGKERQPLAIIEGAPVVFCNKVDEQELRIEIKDDMYKPIFSKIPIHFRGRKK